MLDTKSLKLVADRLHLVDTLLDENVYADKVLAGGKVVNVITKEIYEAEVAITGEYILMVGNCSKLKGPKTEIVDVTGKYITPGFIDAHMHFESAMLTATEFSRLSLPTGTTCLISDPHEIGNVLGKVGMKAMAEEVATLPQHVYLRVPALTPDSPGLETAGKNITSKDIPEMLSWETVTGIGETQGVTTIKFVYEHNYEVIKDTIASTVYARSIGKQVDGNIAGLFGEELAAHIICGGTDISCHETTTKEEAVEKLRYGVYVLMREGSTQYNMAQSVRAITEDGLDSRRAIIATDDMLAEDIINKGHMNDIIRRTIKEGVDPVEAIQMATINPATWLGLSEIGVLAPGKYADIAVIDGKLEDMNVTQVFLKGEKIAENKELLIDLPVYTYPDTVKKSVKRDPITAEDLMIASNDDKVLANCIGLIPLNNLSEKLQVELPVENGYVKSNVEDLLPVAVVGRHGQKDIGKSFVKGFDLKEGAFAETVSHDTHNLIVIGTNYEDMAVAVNRVIELQGGVVIAKDGEVVDELPLRISGLMTDELTAYELTDKMTELHKKAKEVLKCSIPAPFMHLAFLSLSTSPKWKITDKGVVDVENYKVIPSIESIK
ncbi:adenine deaminase C-terminal domain-containing protein [Tissierella sp. MB52-C2]|uniref:adenine deaminase n=1 Tax=Tissierella sp. MB52-C2 TaxID=3070999 RepID=UPI00280B0CD9|nr:adenine deaminase C-terminal domain-containing protein [Tissierella sp. MB52-C2]WMM25288.1 adenine deaminase C-terminal domain-containing protein [Tissierella sp. MB52-C2]